MSIATLHALIAGETKGTVQRDFPLAALTTYKLGGSADLLFEPADPDDLATLGRAVRAAGYDTNDLAIVAIGRGSNLVVSDKGWPGLVIRLGPAFSWIEETRRVGETRPGQMGALRAGAATPLPLLANWTARRGLTGLEFAVAIPGSVGGAVRMNAGAHGGSVGDTLVSVHLYDLSILEVEERSASSLDLGYRHSNLTQTELVLDACFELTRADRDEIRARMESFRRHRAQTQPGALANAGSVFRNPEGDSAGRLIEAAGLKGFRVGGASVSELHANFFMAEPGATAQDVYDLVHEVRARVRDRLGVDLEPEVRFVGSFNRHGAEADA